MRSFEQIVRDGQRGPAFSNGSEYEQWEPHWCGRCLRDAPFRYQGRGTGCPILLAALCADITPAEWSPQPAEQYPHDAYHCTYFRAPGTRSPTPRLRRPPRGMTPLFTLEVDQR